MVFLSISCAKEFTYQGALLIVNRISSGFDRYRYERPSIHYYQAILCYSIDVNYGIPQISLVDNQNLKIKEIDLPNVRRVCPNKSPELGIRPGV
jgi:hypothetical protein